MTTTTKARSRLAVAMGIAALSLSLVAGPALAETKLRISVDTGPNHVRNMTLRIFMERLSAATNGEVVGELFESGQLYPARDEPKAVARGDIDMSVTSNSSVAAFSADLNLLDLPLFSGRSPEQVNQLVDGALGKQLAAGVAAKLGVVVPGRWFLLGFTNTFGANKEIKSFADFKGARIRVPGGAAYIARYKELGAEGVSIPFPDVPMALSQKTIDALLTTAETARSGKLFESGVRGMFRDQVSVLYYVPLVNKGFWDKLTEAQQKAFTETWDSVIDDERAEAVRRQASAVEENAKNGIVVYEPDAAELKDVNARLIGIAPDIATALKIDPAVFDLARDELSKLN